MVDILRIERICRSSPISHIIVLHVASRLDLGLLLLLHEGAKKCIDAE